MSPEYALDGLFSVKSDVFSFGVLLIEVISGKKNTGFYQSENSFNLLGFAWKLWNEDKGLELMDPSLSQTFNKSEVLKCIHVGLLCVQQDPADRPTMNSVLIMFVTEVSNLPAPKQPAFFIRRNATVTESSSTKTSAYSNNEVTITTVGGR
eukprot:TRINITY_DN11661_c0_g1_i1.p1 TRINITY_DN11661_c0_g1~~TRINITY_DN11661_c0_g1_i1.p1  ORF type:complete len:158 (-),score=28.04 TRINITY_DN11661_c0_g1_i1:92-544(-)